MSPGTVVNGIVALIAFSALWIQGYQTNRALRAARRSAAAASRSNRNARAALLQTQQIERPWLTVRLNEEEVEAVLKGGSRPPHGVAIPLRFSMVNDGRSPALMYFASFSCQLVDSGVEPIEPPWDPNDKEFPPVPISPGNDSAIRRVRLRPLSETEYGIWATGTASLRFFCRIKYRDVFGPDGQGHEHESRFCWGWQTFEASEEAKALGMTREMQSKPMGGPRWNSYT